MMRFVVGRAWASTAAEAGRLTVPHCRSILQDVVKAGRYVSDDLRAALHAVTDQLPGLLKADADHPGRKHLPNIALLIAKLSGGRICRSYTPRLRLRATER